MNEWNEGYFTATPYTYGYYRELSPTFQRFCLTLKGFDAPESTDESLHCELAYGQGMSINIHAASTLGQYFGTDFNPSQVANANDLARASGANVQLFEDSFEEFRERLFDQKIFKRGGGGRLSFDSIGLHGIWSWISADNQKHIVEIIRRHLKSGGVVYNSYNCFPGWAPAAPLRELFKLYDKFVGNTESNTKKRVDAAIKFAEELLEAKPAYLARVPWLTSRLDEIKKHDHNYIAHEYFNREWKCPYFTDLVETMSEAKLDYVCTAEPIDAIDRFNLKSEALEFLKTIENPIVREQVRDYFISRQFRKDLYVRGARRLSELERQRRLIETPFVLMTTKKLPTNLTLPTVVGSIGLPEPAINAIHDYLTADGYRPKSFAEFIRKHPAPFDILEQVIVILVNNYLIMPCQSEAAIEKVKPRCDALNDYICRRAETSTELSFLASPVINGAYMLNPSTQPLVPIIRRGADNIEDAAREMWKIMLPLGRRMIRDGKPLQSDEENIAELKKSLQPFFDNILPILRALRIV